MQVQRISGGKFLMILHYFMWSGSPLELKHSRINRSLLSCETLPWELDVQLGQQEQFMDRYVTNSLFKWARQKVYFVKIVSFSAALMVQKLSVIFSLSFKFKTNILTKILSQCNLNIKPRKINNHLLTLVV